VSDQSYLTDAGDLHRRGYTARAVHARWVLEAFGELHRHLTEQGEPIKDLGACDPSFLLDPGEWDEVRRAAQTITDLASAVSVSRRMEMDEAAIERTERP
jgi:hypothetical protein